MSASPPNSAKLAGSGTGVKIWLVMTLTLEPALKDSVIVCAKVYGVVVRLVITAETELDWEPGA